MLGLMARFQPGTTIEIFFKFSGSVKYHSHKRISQWDSEELL